MSLDVQASSRTELEPTVLDTEPSDEPGPLADGMPETNDDIGSLKLPHPGPRPSRSRRPSDSSPWTCSAASRSWASWR